MHLSEQVVTLQKSYPTHPIVSILIKNDIASLYQKYLTYRDEGWVDIQSEGDLRIIAYSKECQYARHWDEYTVAARGLVLDVKENKLVGLPFPKFFNHAEYLPDTNLGTPLGYEYKYDGSLGIVFYYNGRWQVATKKSFKSEQALWAQKIIDEVSPHLLNSGPLGYTHLFEIIYKENRIVVDYEGFEGLVYLGTYSNFSLQLHKMATENLMAHPQIKDSTYHPTASLEEVQEILSFLEGTNAEGIVVNFDKVGKVKFKTAHYQALHKLVSDITPRTVWELLDKHLFNVTEALSCFPEEFRRDVDDIAQPMINEYNNRYIQILDNFDGLRRLSLNRKEFALGAKVFHPAVTMGLFMMLDGKTLEDIKKAVSYSVKP